MALNVAKEVAATRHMTVPDLRRKYAEVFGEDCRSRHKRFLIKRIIWRMQANAEGGLSERARRRAEEPANEADLRVQTPRRALVAEAVEAAGSAHGRPCFCKTSAIFHISTPICSLGSHDEALEGPNSLTDNLL